MLRTLLFFFIFWLLLLITYPLVIFYYLLFFLRTTEIWKKYIQVITSCWAKFTLFTAGMKVDISGIENIKSKNSRFVIISNHESNFDIPILLAILPFSPAFVAKIELTRFPVLNTWMKILECLTIDRKNPKSARNKISMRIQQDGMNPLVLFPEGTRSRGQGIGIFKTGSLKLIFQNQLEILPVTISGSHKAYEMRKSIQPAKVNVKFHPIIKTIDYLPKNFPGFLADLQQVISRAQ